MELYEGVRGCFLSKDIKQGLELGRNGPEWPSIQQVKKMHSSMNAPVQCYLIQYTFNLNQSINKFKKNVKIVKSFEFIKEMKKQKQ